MKLVCDQCGKKFKPGNSPCGIPNGMAFVMQDGSKITVCSKCIMKLGREVQERDK